MKESVIYQKILNEGRALEARRWLVKLGEKEFRQPPNATIVEEIEAIKALDAIEQLVDNLSKTKSWDDLLLQIEASPFKNKT